MSIILHPRTIQTQESAQITTWTADVPSIKTISLENGHRREEFINSSKMEEEEDRNGVAEKSNPSKTPSVTITPIFNKAAGAGKRKGTYPLKNVKRSGIPRLIFRR